MTAVFLRFFNLSVTAGWMVLAVLLLRLCFKKAPRWITCMLWGLVALRLVVPFTIESPVSLIPTAQTVVSTETTDSYVPVVNSGMSAIDKPLNDWLQMQAKPQGKPSVQSPMPPVSDITPNASEGDTNVTPQPSTQDTPTVPEEGPVDTEIESVSRAERILKIAAPVWLVGIALMLIYEILSILRVRFRVLDAVRLRDNVWQSDRVASPFIFGLFRPRIYIPYGLEESVLEQVLSHEQAHLHRRDHWIKPFAFTLLAVYWYNPLLWAGYILLCRDIEVACDQRVIRALNEDDRRQYATALLQCGVERRPISACPLAFGEVSVKQRIKSVLNYRKPLLWVIVASLVVCAVAAVCLLTVPKSKEQPKDEPLVVLSSQEVKPAEERQFYGTDTDGAIVPQGLEWLWANAENPDQKTVGASQGDETNIPLVLSHSKVELDELIDALSDDDWDQVDMQEWMNLEKYDDTYFEQNAIVWLFVPGYDLGNYNYTVTLEETNKGWNYAVTLDYLCTELFSPLPSSCQYLLLLEIKKDAIEEVDSFTTRHEKAPIKLPTEEEGLSMLSVGNADLNGDGEAEDIRIYYSDDAFGSGWDSGYAQMVVSKKDGTPILREGIFYQYHSQCYLVSQEDGSSLLLFIEADERGTYYACESFGAVSLKDDERTVLDVRHDGRVVDYLDLGDVITYAQSLSGFMENAQLLYERADGTLYYGDKLGDAPQYQPLCWLEEYRESDADTLQDILENIIDSLHGEVVPLGEIDFDGDGELNPISALYYTRRYDVFYTCLLVRESNGDLLTSVGIQRYSELINENEAEYLYRVTDETGKERLQLVTMSPGTNDCYVYDLTMGGLDFYRNMSPQEVNDYIQGTGIKLICCMQGKELYFPYDEDTGVTGEVYGRSCIVP